MSVHDLLDLDLLFLYYLASMLFPDGLDLVLPFAQVDLPLGFLFIDQLDVGMHQLNILQPFLFGGLFDLLLLGLILDQQLLGDLLLVGLLHDIVLGLLLHLVL